MQNMYQTENVNAVAMPYTPISNILSMPEDPQIKHTRVVLMVILGVCLALTVANLIPVLVQGKTPDAKINNSKGPVIGQIVVSILFYGFGLLVAYRYSQIGLRIFAWLIIVGLIFSGIILVFLVVIAIIGLIAVVNMHDVSNKSTMIGAVVALFVLVAIYIAAYVLSVIIVKLAFKLARLIDANKRFSIQQI